MEFMIVICLTLTAALIISLYKIRLLRRGYDELTEDIKEQIKGDTGVPIVLTTSDPKAVKCAEELNEELRKLQDERRRYINGNQKIKDAVTGISHDLRTPLTAIKSYLDMIDEESDESTKKEYLSRIRNRTDALTDLTEELFKYTTLTDKDEAVTGNAIEDTDIRRTLEECLISFYGAFTQKGFEPEIKMPGSPVMVKCRKGDADRIFENIIGNVIKYSEGDPVITLTEDATVTFSNPASSLTPLTVAKLFDKYYTVNDAKGSTGLGFSITKELIERNGGSVKAELIGEDLKISLKFCL